LPRLAAKNLWARKGRAFTTTLAVFIGVALVAGTYVLTDTINAAFDEIFSESLKGTDVVITAREPVKQDSGVTPTFSAKLLPEVRRVRGVSLAAGAVFTPGGFFKQDGSRIGSQFSPKFISSVLPPRLESLTVTDGHEPRSPRQATLDQAGADSAGLEIGDPIRIAGERRARIYRLVGTTKLGNASFGGASIAQLTLPEAQLITDNQGRFDQISVAAAKGVPAAALAKRIAAIAPANVRVETGQQNANRQSSEIRDNLSFLQIALLVFAGVALFVGAFLIFNTFSITVAQRVREFAMLRTLGASRGQILSSVVAEAALIGLVGSLAGLAGGIAFAKGIQAIFEAVGIDLPTTSPVIETRTVIVSLAIGLTVTLVSSLAPAWRSTRVPPLAALREGELPEARSHGLLFALGAVAVSLIGLVALLAGLFGDISDSGQAAGLMGLGAVLMMLGVSLFSPRLVRPLASITGIPLEKLRGLTGRLARENSQRRPGRTAATAAALMVGLALVSFVTIFAAGLKGSIASAVDRNFQGELVIQNTDGFSPIPAAAASAARKVPGVGTVSSLRSAQAVIEGSGKNKVTGLDPATANRVLTLDWKQGSASTLSDLRDGGAILDDNFASDNGIEVGDRIRMLTNTGARPSFRVTGTVGDDADLIGSVIITQAAMSRYLGNTQDQSDLIKLAPGASADAVQARLRAVLRDAFPTTDVLNQAELKSNQENAVDKLLGLIYALLSLAVIVSLFGIANTLALSIHERTRELGMLRAIGMSRRQVRRMIRYEAVITAMIGAVLGLVLGVIFAALISRPLADEGFTLSYPIGTLIAIMALAALAGVLVAIAPARRASRLDVLEALAYE
jgi:putative ABC transport system permease protein